MKRTKPLQNPVGVPFPFLKLLDNQYADFKLDQQAFMRMLNVFDLGRKGQLKLGDYVSMILFLKSCKRIFKAFDRKNCGRIVLDYDQYVYAAGHARYGSQTTYTTMKAIGSLSFKEPGKPDGSPRC